MLLVANLANKKGYKKIEKNTETLVHGYSCESTQQQELSNEYQHDRVKMISKNLCVLVLWNKIRASTLEGLNMYLLVYFFHSRE